MSVPSLYTLYPVTPMLSVDVVHEMLIWEEEMGVAVRFVGTEGAVMSPTMFDTITFIKELVVVFPATSLAVAVMVCEPLDVVVVSQVYA